MFGAAFIRCGIVIIMVMKCLMVVFRVMIVFSACRVDDVTFEWVIMVGGR